MQPKLRFKGFTDDWEQREFGKIVEKRKQNKKSIDLPYVEYADISSNTGKLNKNIFSRNEIKQGIIFQKNDVLFGKLRPYLNNWLNPQFIGIAVGDFWVLNGINLNNNFLYYYIQTKKFSDVANVTTGTKMPRSDWKLVSNSRIYIPNSTEQNFIGEIFCFLEKLLALYEQKINLLLQIKKYLLDNLFTEKDYPNLRFKGFTDEWKQCKLEKLFSERKERSTKGILLSVTLTKGVIKTTDLDKKINSNVITGNYKVVKKNDIPYNSMRMWQGASGISNYEGIVSPAYTVLVPNSGINSRFYSIAFKRKSSLNLFTKFSQGLTSDTWNLKYPLIKNIKMPYTSLKEQIQITCLFEKFDKLIDLYEQNLSHLKELKKYLLQNMFC